MMNTCKKTGKQFEITKEDFEFYSRVSPVITDKKYPLHPPSLCSDERIKRRLAFRNERNLYTRKCDFSGETILSTYSPDKPYKVFKQDIWWSDKWDARDYGQEFDFSRPFFEQVDELWKRVPQIALSNSQCENSEYTNFTERDKNCYMDFASNRNENCYYCEYTWDSNDCADCFYVEKSELLYMCTYCTNCYHCIYCERCTNSSNLDNCFDCRSCNDCFACTGLRKKSYCILNKQYSEKEYKRIIANPEKRNQILQEFKILKLTTPRLYANIINCENCSGDNLRNCKNAIECYNSFDLHDAKFVENSPGKSRDVYDVSGCCDTELSYELVGVCFGYMLFSCMYSHTGLSHSLYCIACKSSKNLFGCIGIKKGEYCILNKQYTKEEYEALLPKIIEHMKRTGEWGEFFPASISPFGYNETVANEYFPMKKEDAIHERFKWSDYESPTPKTEKSGAVIECKISKKPFKLIKPEIDFYKKMNLPLPDIHPDLRHLERMKARNPLKIWDRKCSKLGHSIKTTYSPERSEKIYCEKCYLETVY